MAIRRHRELCHPSTHAGVCVEDRRLTSTILVLVRVGATSSDDAVALLPSAREMHARPRSAPRAFPLVHAAKGRDASFAADPATPGRAMRDLR